MQKLRVLFGSVLLVLASSLLVLAQTGSIAGTVTDSAGAVVPAAEVTVRNTQSNAVRTTTTSGVGAFTLPDLTAGTYEVTVKKESFKVFRVPSIPLTVAQVLTLNAKLEPGAVTEQVEVSAQVVQDVDLETSQVSNLVDQRQIVSLPLITRDPYNLVLLSPGTSQTNTSLGGITVNGSRERNNNFLLDGVDNNDTSVPGIIGGVLSANPDSAQEFRVITNNFNAEFGRNTGAIVDVITKSGTNTFHGGVYEFGRWNGFGGARDYFNPPIDANGNASPQDPYIRNQFGYSIGGPIHKNKTFFFFNEEFDRFVTTLTSSAIVPTAAFKTGVFNYIDANGAHPIDLTANDTRGQNNFGLSEDPTVQRILALYPNAPTSSDGISGTIFFPTSSRQKGYNTVAKIDHHINDRHSLSFRYGYDNLSDPDPGHADNLPGGIGAYAEKAISQSGAANWTATLSNTLINSFNFGWNQIFAGFTCTGTKALDGVTPVDSFGNGTDYYMDPFTSFACDELVADGQARKTGTTSYGDTLSWVHGAHTFKFGADFRNIRESGASNFFSRRQVNLNFFQVFGDPNDIGFNLIDVPGVTDTASGFTLSDAAAAYYGMVGEDFNGQFFDKAGVRKGNDNKNFRQHEYDWFVQDSWKVRPNLTLNLGLRYQLDGVPYEESGNFSNLLTSPAAFPVVFSVVGPGTGKQLYHQDYSNIEPRVGFSWDPWGDGKTSVRAGFGIFHDRVFGNLFGNARGNPPFEQDYVNFTGDTMTNAFTNPGDPPDFPAFAPTQKPSATVADDSGLAPIIFDPNFRNTLSNNWNFGIQRDLPSNFVLDLAYVGSRGVHIDDQVDGNPPDPNLVQQLVAICSNPSDPRNTTGCTPSQVSGIFLYEGTDFGVLPFNAVAHNALVQPFFQISEGSSSYNALQLKLTHRLSHGLEMQGSYTWAHALDDSADPLAPAQGNRTFPRNSRNLLQDWGNSDNDIRQIGVISYVYELPFGRGKSYASGGALGRILEGFEFSGITTLQTGHPFEVRSTTDSQRTGVSSWAQLVGDPFAPTPAGAKLGTGRPYFTNPTAFKQPAFGGPGNIARNQFYGPSFVNFDLSVSKKTKLTERVELELRFEGYNIFNHPHFSNPGDLGSSLGNLVQSGNSNLGIITSTVTQPDGTTSARQMQVALKLNF